MERNQLPGFEPWSIPVTILTEIPRLPIILYTPVILLALCLSLIKPYELQRREKVEVYLHLFLTSPLDRDGSLDSSSDSFTSKEQALGTQLMGGCMAPIPVRM
jgi:hypothetical protein